MVRPNHQYFTTSDGVEIHYLSLGISGSPVVLIHGFAGSAERYWFDTGIAGALAENHRVFALDCRNHGQSAKSTPFGPGRDEDVIELMDALSIERAHFHGYSMGGGTTARLLNIIPERMITASFGGFGFLESDPNWIKRVPADVEGIDPDADAADAAYRLAAASDNGMDPETADRVGYNWRPAVTPEIMERVRQGQGVDLTRVRIPIMAINGEFDRPLQKTHRMWRELRNFTNVVLPGKSHLTAIMAGYLPPEYSRHLARFIDANDLTRSS